MHRLDTPLWPMLMLPPPLHLLAVCTCTANADFRVSACGSCMCCTHCLRSANGQDFIGADADAATAAAADVCAAVACAHLCDDADVRVSAGCVGLPVVGPRTRRARVGT